MMPSDFEKSHYEGDPELLLKELPLRQAEAREALTGVRKAVKMIGARAHEKSVHSYGQELNTRANSDLRTFQRRRDVFIDIYNKARDRIRALDPDTGILFPYLSLKDTYRPAPESRRPTGTSRRIDGTAIKGIILPMPACTLSASADARQSDMDPSNAITTRKKARRNAGKEQPISSNMQATHSSHSGSRKDRKPKTSKPKNFKKLAGTEEIPDDDVNLKTGWIWDGFASSAGSGSMTEDGAVPDSIIRWEIESKHFKWLSVRLEH